jgi:hypothetical protein
MITFPIYGKSYSSHVPVTTNQKTNDANLTGRTTFFGEHLMDKLLNKKLEELT